MLDEVERVTIPEPLPCVIQRPAQVEMAPFVERTGCRRTYGIQEASSQDVEGTVHPL